MGTITVGFHDACGGSIGNTDVYLVGNGSYQLLAANGAAAPAGR